MAEPVRFGKYEILEELGRGGFAVVYKARDTTLDRIVAIKILHPHVADDPAFMQRFYQESRTAARLRHPHIATVYEVGDEAGQHYLTMTFLPGQTLDGLLKSAGEPPSLERTVSIVEQIAGALDYVHGQGLVHRDVKPSNIMVDDAGQATLLDFGIARAADGTQLTTTGTVMGTPQYMSPEQAEGEEIDARSDVYSLGVVAYQMCTGQAPFDDVSPLVVLRLHADRPPPAPRELNPRLPLAVERVLLRSLAKKRDRRYQSAGELASDLRRATDRAQPRLRRPQRRVIPTWAWWAAAGGAALAVLLGLGLALGSRLFGASPAPTEAPTGPPTEVSTAFPTEAPTEPPTETPTETPTREPTAAPTEEPTPAGPPAGASLGDTWTRPADGMAMVYVPAGEFEMGSTEGDDDERPVHTVALDGFWIDRTEVTNAHYRRCVEAGGCGSPLESSSYTRDSYYGDSTYDNYPVINVTWHQAAAYCTWAEARLPTEAEWEYAARGPEGRVFPWGDEFDGTRLNYCDANCPQEWADAAVDDGYADTAPVGSYPGGASWCGALDIAGNVWEWVADRYGDYPSGRQVNPTGPSSGYLRVLRGGSWSRGRDVARCAVRLRDLPGYRLGIFGFRCARGSQ